MAEKKKVRELVEALTKRFEVLTMRVENLEKAETKPNTKKKG